MGGQPIVALMGPEANHWVNRHGRFYLRSKDYINPFPTAAPNRKLKFRVAEINNPV